MGHDPVGTGTQTGGVAQYSPKHWVKLSPFFIDQYPVTNGQYKACFDAGACPDECQNTGACTGGEYYYYHMADPTLADYPVQSATFAGAVAYCTWMGKRLPTEAEWERAARGPQGFDYPWGNARPDCSQMHCGPLAQPGLPMPYDFRYPVLDGGADVSPEGVHDMVTNGLELVHDWMYVYYYQATPSPVENPQGPDAGTDHVGRGKYFWVIENEYGVEAPFQAWSREAAPPAGFRCARGGSTPGASSRFIELRQRILTGRGGPQ